MQSTRLRNAVGLAVAIVLATASAGDARDAPAGEPVATTPHFAFYSDFDSNLHDALLEAGRDKNFQRPALFEEGDEAKCFGDLPEFTRAAWKHAEDYYAEFISPGGFDDWAQFWIRMDVSGALEVERDRDVALVRSARGLRDAAAPAYEACRWEVQDAENRKWIADIMPLLELYEEATAKRLEALYKTPLGGLPIRYDVVETVNWSGATTIVLDPAGGHVQMSTEYEGLDALEIVFHEASHTLMGRNAPIQTALATAADEVGVELPRDLWHAVLFYTTGDSVRRVLYADGEPYTPMLFAEGIFEHHHAVMKRTWPAYLDGQIGLEEAAENLLRAVGEAAERAAG